MSAENRSQPAPLPLTRRVGYVVVTLVAFGLDAQIVIPEAEDRDGQRWTAFGVWDTTILTFTLVMAAAYAALLLRRRWPLPVLVTMSAVTLVLLHADQSSQPVAGLLVSLYTAASLVERRWQAWLALGVGAVTQIGGLLLNLGLGDDDIEVALLLMGGVTYAVWLFGRREHRAVVAESVLPDRLAAHGHEAAAQERTRIARELHDILAHSVSAMMMQAAGAKAMTGALRQDLAQDLRLETVERALSTIENTGSQSMRELHRLLSVLRGGGEEVQPDAESSSQPGVADITPLVELTRQSGLVVEVHTAGPPVKLDPSVGLAAYRVVQESLTNAMKHGGRGAVVDIFQNWQDDGLQLQVRSRSGHEGIEPGSVGGGNGLYGLRERVELIGGTFESGWVGDEFVVTVVLPLTPTLLPGGGSDGGRGGWLSGHGGFGGGEIHGGHGTRLDGVRAGEPSLGRGVLGARRRGADLDGGQSL